jgi:hypothetical protein
LGEFFIIAVSIEFLADFWNGKAWQPRFDAQSREEQCVLYCSVEARVVAEDKGQQILLPFPGGVVDIGGEVLGDSFDGDFSLTVGLRMSGSGVYLLHSEVLKELFCHSGSELLACVQDEVDWYNKMTDPVVKNGGGESGSFLGRESNKLDIFCKGIHDAEDVLLSSCGGFEGPKKLTWTC